MKYNLKELVASMWEHREKKDFGRKDLKTTYRGLSVKASIGMTGNLSKIPWVSYCAEGQETQKGIYPVLLFYGTPEFVRANTNKDIVKKIILAYGISATSSPSMNWGAEIAGAKTIGDVLKDLNYKTNDYSIKKYNSSYVYKVYDWKERIDYNKIQEDLDCLIDIYFNIIKGSKKYKPIDEFPVPSVSEPKTTDIPVTIKLNELAESANAALPDSLLEAIKKISPKSFEILIAKLLMKMGYGNTIEDVIVTQYVGDDGIDGYVRKDRLDIEKICAYQAKRYTKQNVSNDEMTKLGGAMINYGTRCGIFVTTSDFTAKAKDYNPVGFKMIRINGNDLVNYLIEYGIGVKTEEIKVQTVDLDYLNNLEVL